MLCMYYYNNNKSVYMNISLEDVDCVLDIFELEFVMAMMNRNVAQEPVLALGVVVVAGK